MKIKNIITGGLIAVTLSACAQTGSNAGGPNKQDVGTLLGAVGGAFAGAQFGKGKGQLASVAAGTLLGAALGNSVGASLDKADMMYYNQTSQSALEKAKANETVTWKNPDSGNSGTITPTRTFQTATGSYCREYTQTVMVGGQKNEAFGTACRQPDGAWQIQQ